MLRKSIVAWGPLPPPSMRVVDRVTVKVMFTPVKVSHAECVAATEWVHSTGLSDEYGIEQEAV